MRSDINPDRQEDDGLDEASAEPSPPVLGDEPTQLPTGEVDASGKTPEHTATRGWPARSLGEILEHNGGSATLGRYTVLDTLGEGGMGIVLRAFDRELDRSVALKILHKDIDAQHITRLRREAQALAKLSHPNVVQVYEVGEVEGRTFVAMELIKGRTLDEWMRQQPRPTWRACVEVFLQLGAGLSNAHDKGLVHRDFKPSNAIIDHEGRARVLDFGLARRRHEQDDELAAPTLQSNTDQQEVPLEISLTKTGAVLGTPAYMSLEQMAGEPADERSDQFSYCVSLYEAVYGERPYQQDTLPQLVTTLQKGQIQPAPKGSAVPAELRRVLKRGLAADPSARWPSMHALLHELQRLVAPRRRRWLVGLSGGLAAGLGLLGAGLVYQADMGQRCTGALARMDGIWDDTRRQAIETAILDTELVYAPGTWDRIEPQLDAYVDEWVAIYTETCEATSVRGEQSDQVLHLRMHCLDQRHTALRATVDALAEANAAIVTRAVSLVTDLPPLAHCNDTDRLEQLGQRVSPPEDPDIAAKVEVLRARLANIWMARKIGQFASTLDEVEEAMEQVDTLGYLPLRAEILLLRGTLRFENGEYTAAEQDLRQAHTLAVEVDDDATAIDAAQALTGIVGHHLRRYSEGRQWAETVALPLARRIGDRVREAQILGNLGIIFDDQMDFENAKLYYQQAFAMFEETLGPDHPNMAAPLTNLGSMLDTQGYFDEATLYHQQALAIFKRTLGPDHPHVAICLHNLGLVYYHQGDLDSAELYYQRALSIRERTLDRDHPMVASTLFTLGKVFDRQGDSDNAKLHYQRALAIREKTLGPDHPEVTASLLMLAQTTLAAGDTVSARGYAERVLSEREVSTLAPAVLAKAHFILARVLWHEPSQRARARTLAELAREVFAESNDPEDPEITLAEVEAWLATHRVK